MGVKLESIPLDTIGAETVRFADGLRTPFLRQNQPARIAAALEGRGALIDGTHFVVLALVLELDGKFMARWIHGLSGGDGARVLAFETATYSDWDHGHWFPNEVAPTSAEAAADRVRESVEAWIREKNGDTIAPRFTRANPGMGEACVAALQKCGLRFAKSLLVRAAHRDENAIEVATGVVFGGACADYYAREVGGWDSRHERIRLTGPNTDSYHDTWDGAREAAAAVDWKLFRAALWGVSVGNVYIGPSLETLGFDLQAREVARVLERHVKLSGFPHGEVAAVVDASFGAFVIEQILQILPDFRVRRSFRVTVYGLANYQAAWNTDDLAGIVELIDFERRTHFAMIATEHAGLVQDLFTRPIMVDGQTPDWNAAITEAAQLLRIREASNAEWRPTFARSAFEPPAVDEAANSNGRGDGAEN